MKIAVFRDEEPHGVNISEDGILQKEKLVAGINEEFCCSILLGYSAV
jgi:hypothetical protein